MFGISGTEWLMILLLVLLLFGGKRIPELARGLGKGIAEFKKGVKDIDTEIQQADDGQSRPNPSANSQAQPYRFDPQTGKPISENPAKPSA